MHNKFSKFIFAETFLLFFVSAFCFINLRADTYYISVSGSDVYGVGSSTSPWATFAKAFSSSGMKGGDTLIIKDGIYTGSNMIISRPTRQPPNGSENSWTIIKAEHDGEVVIDGSNYVNTMFNIDYIGYPRQDRYWQFEGIIWQKTYGTNVNINTTRYVKFLRCGGCDASNGNTSNFSTGSGAEYILFENCYGYGNGRYKFVIYKSAHCIVRQCVGRNDRADSQNSGPIATFAAYSSDDIEMQNCISVDCDQLNSYYNYYQLAGCYYVPCTSADSKRINITNCVGINSKIGAVWIDGTRSYVSSNVYVNNSVFWNCSNKLSSQYALCSVRGYDSCFTNCTFGSCRADFYNMNSYDGIGYNNQTKIINSIYYNIDTSPSTSVFNDVEKEDYNCLYGNTLNYLNTVPGANTKLNINPIYSSTNTAGALKYPVRIESGSNLSGIGEEGKDIGANCVKLVGKNGSLWGDADYNTEQEEMWPFPNEALIRAKMKAYSGGGVSGDRGFCSGDWTLTRYIWEALGNAAPLSFLPLNAPSNLAAATNSANMITLSWLDNAVNEIGFKIERKTELGGTYSLIAEAAADTQYYEDTGLNAATTYYYRIRAYNSSANSDYSNESSAVTASYSIESPSNLAASAISTNTISLSWTDNSLIEKGFKIERKTDGHDFNQISTVSSNTVSYIDINLVSGTTYYYRIKAYDNFVNSEYSNESFAVTLNIKYNNIISNFNNLSDNTNTNTNINSNNNGNIINTRDINIVLLNKINPGDIKIVGTAANKGAINPDAGETAQIYFNGGLTGKYECRIFTLTGEQVWHEEKDNVSQGIFNWIPTNIPSGGYVVYVKGPDMRICKKIAILK